MTKLNYKALLSKPTKRARKKKTLEPKTKKQPINSSLTKATRKIKPQNYSIAPRNTQKAQRIRSLEDLSVYLKTKRLENGISLEKLSLHCETSRQSLSRFENQRQDIKFRNILKILKFLGLKIYVSKGEI